MFQCARHARLRMKDAVAPLSAASVERGRRGSGVRTRGPRPIFRLGTGYDDARGTRSADLSLIGWTGLHSDRASNFREAFMPHFQFSLNSSDTVRQAGIIQSDSFADALNALIEELAVEEGDTLEIGVKGFPPARFEYVSSPDNGTQSWRPAGRLAA